MNKKKIIAILSSRVAYGKERSNIEVYHLLNDSGMYDLTVLTSLHAEKRLFDLLDGLNIIKLDFPDRHDHSVSLFNYIIHLPIINYKILRLLKTVEPDVLFVNDELSCYDLYWSLIRFKGKIVYRIGDAPAYPDLRFFFFNSRMWHNLGVKKVDTFVCISEYINKTVIATGRCSEKDKVIYNYPPTRKKVFKRLPITKVDRLVTFGYIGQINKPKGVDLYVMAAKKILATGYDCQFLIAGSLQYDMEFGKKIKKMTSTESSITLLGEIDDIESFYNSIDVLVVPSIKEEPLGNVIVEAKSYHRPCVIFPSGGMPELITHKIDGYICGSKTENALFEGMKFYCDNKMLLSSHKQASYESILKLGIDRKTYEQKWFEVFERY